MAFATARRPAELQHRIEGMRTVDRCLTAQLFEHLRRSCETITRLSDRDVQNQLVDSQLPHRVGALVFAFRHLDLCVKMMGLTIETEYAMRIGLVSRDVEVGAGILESARCARGLAAKSFGASLELDDEARSRS